MSISFGNKSVTSRSSPRITISEGNIVSYKNCGKEILIYLSEYALKKFRNNNIMRLKIVFKGSNETKEIVSYSIKDLFMDDCKVISNRLYCLCKLARVG